MTEVIVISPDLTSTPTPPASQSFIPSLALTPPPTTPPASSSSAPPPPTAAASDTEYSTQPSTQPSSPSFKSNASPSSPPSPGPRRARPPTSHPPSTPSTPPAGPAPAPAPAPSLLLCVKPHWVQHAGGPIYGCDVDPLSQRFVTCGADHNLRVWSLPPLLSDPAPDAPLLLATLTNHNNPVNCVRFSPLGRLIASAGDGRPPAILLWRLHEADDDSFQSSKPFGDEEQDVDRWSLHAQLMGHTSDIQDLSFSPDGRYLASASVDNDVIIWDVRTCEARRKLRGHRGWVKGVSWDPKGRYVASLGDDQTLIVWDSADDWKVKRAITESLIGGDADADGQRKVVGRIGINEKMKQVHFSRLSWVADGSAIGASNGWDGGGRVSVAPVFSRQSWTRWCAFVGHQHPTTCTKFNPRMFTRQPLHPPASAPVSTAASPVLTPASTGGGARRRSARNHLSTQSLDKTKLVPPFYPLHSVCAVGSLDNSITIWVTSSADVLTRFGDFFDQAVIDLAWSADGYSLLACSHDGTVAFFRFTEEELGRALTDDEMRQHMHRQYGEEGGAGGEGTSDALDGVLGMEIEEMGMEYGERLRTARADHGDEVGASPPARAASVAKLTSAEVMARQKEAQKLDKKGRVRRVVTPLHLEGGTVFSSSAPPPVVIVELPPVPTFSALSTAPLSVDVTADGKRPRESRESRESDGQSMSHKKRRHVGPTGETVANGIAPHVSSSSGTSSSATARGAGPSSAPAESASAPMSTVVRRHVIPPAPMQRQLVCKLLSANASLRGATQSTSVASVVECIPPAAPSRFPPSSPPSSHPRVFSTLVCRGSGAEQWQTLLPGHCTLLQSSPAGFIAACCREHHGDDSGGSLHLLSHTGRRLLPPIHLSSPPAFLSISSPLPSSLQSPHLLVVTSVGGLLLLATSPYVCQMDISIASLVSSSSFSAARVTSDGRVLVMTVDGKCWIRDEQMKLWLDVGDADWTASNFQSRLGALNALGGDDEAEAKSLQAIQREAKQLMVGTAPSALLSFDGRTRTLHTIAHLEVRRTHSPPSQRLAVPSSYSPSVLSVACPLSRSWLRRCSWVLPPNTSAGCRCTCRAWCRWSTATTPLWTSPPPLR